MAKEDISNRTVLVLALLVVLIVASSTWMVLNKLNNLSQDAQQVDTLNLQESKQQSEHVSGGKVEITVLPSKEEA
ncbi:hypothetical protein HY501_02925 [Candidatus Woesearchaeota archaeon]|nr:hypothetical protein [Candidatus Woesearchaeota archaeon]